MIRNFFRVMLTLWAGSLWSLASWVAPTLFSLQSDRHMAGILATRLFSVETYLGLAVAVLALILPGRTLFVPCYLAVGLLAVDEWAVKHAMNVAQARGAFAGLSFGAWHGVSAVLYVVACVMVLVVIWKRNP